MPPIDHNDNQVVVASNDEEYNHEVAVKAYLESLEQDKIDESDEPSEAPVTTSEVKALDLAFPRIALQGTLGELASLLSKDSEVSPEMAFGAGLTCLGSMVTGRLRTTKDDSDVRLFTVLLGPSYSGKKSSAIKKVQRFFETSVSSAHPLHICEGVGSAEGLARKLNEHENLLFSLDELESFFKKSGIEGSVLLQTVNGLFEKTSYQTVTKNVDISIPKARLSFLAACTLATYEQCWSPAALSIGFDNRLFLVNGSPQDAVPWQKAPPEQETRALAVRIQMQLAKLGDEKHPLILDATPAAYNRYKEWYVSEIHGSHSPYAKRLDTIASRLLPLLTFTQDQSVIEVATVDQVIAVMRHQLSLRQCYNPIDAENKSAQLELSIQRKLREKGPLLDRDLQQAVNAHRCGIYFYRLVVDNLAKEKVIGKTIDKATGKVDHRWRLLDV